MLHVCISLATISQELGPFAGPEPCKLLSVQKKMNAFLKRRIEREAIYA